MVRNIKKKKIAFGIQSKRFEFSGLHPRFEKKSFTYKYPFLAPGCYYSSKTEEKQKGIGYAVSLESEEFSRHLGCKVDHILKAKAWMKSVNGPGWHEVSIEKNLKFGTIANASRFPSSRGLSVPGPGTYGKGHIPQARLEEKSKSSFSNIPTFEFDNCMPRTSNISRSYHLPPNIYKVKSSIEELIQKVISKRGPYDLFTGKRDETSIYGHFTKVAINPNSRSLDFPSTLERLNNKCNGIKGKFMRCGRQTFPTIREVLTDPALANPDPDSPGPGAYNPYMVRKSKTSSKFPFDSSVLHARPPKKIELKAPPDRYYPYKKKRIFGNGMRSAFLSKVKRGISLPEKTSWFE